MKKIFIILMLSVPVFGILTGQKPVDYLLKSKVMIGSGRPEDALQLLNSVIDKFKESKLFISRAEAYMAKGDYSMAISDLNEANIITPFSGEYHLARIYAIKGDAATAVYHLEQNIRSPFKKAEKEILLDQSFSIIESRQEWKQFWKKEWYGAEEKRLSEIEYYLSAGNSDEAENIFSALSDSYPGSDITLYAEALIKVARKDFEGASKTIAGLLSEEPSDGKYLRLQAKVQEAVLNPSGASVTYTKLLDMGVDDPGLIMARAECYRKTGELDKALSDAQFYLDLYPDNLKALSFAGKVAAASGDNLKAIEYFSQNLKLHPNDASCYIDRANSYFVSRSWDWAVKDYSMSLDLDPSNSDAWLNKGISLLNRGNNIDACYDFKKAFSLGNKRATELISRNCIK